MQAITLSTLGLNFNIALATSLSLLWGMINTVQIIIYMPLMNVDFPPNAVFFYSFITDIAQFNIIPASWAPPALQAVAFSDPYNPPSNF